MVPPVGYLHPGFDIYIKSAPPQSNHGKKEQSAQVAASGLADSLEDHDAAIRLIIGLIRFCFRKDFQDDFFA